MAYTRGNLAVQERQKEAQSTYLEKTKVIKRRSQLPQKEKLLYLLSVVLVVAVMGVIGMRHVHSYDLNRQIQRTEAEIRTAQREIDLLQVKKQTLEMEILDKAKELGYVPIEDHNAIHVQPSAGTRGTQGPLPGQND
ncbi:MULTISPECIES: cell division protein FtsL [Paenibacillus]|uniref:Cell division protein FtsL n=1 Tax=Paenibacillus campinasensis TaxID=66347 RepID=A0A268F4T4_9BACL|nr:MULTISPECIES: cell division protein FtsL [Paenibacillus]MUG64649.1 cell division protein FtsL [Paenibacillus campinasensis]PAD80369.1 cell division protein FtsL [Paenibacillus campinasensis]PAK55352.1 cell division protein FtsL [Paenibacillus sp. 7541]